MRAKARRVADPTDPAALVAEILCGRAARALPPTVEDQVLALVRARREGPGAAWGVSGDERAA